MKKIWLLAVSVFSVFILAGCNLEADLKIYLPNDYINKDVVRAFEKETGKKVALVTFDSNEVALSQVKVNSYDVVIPSDYGIEELAKENYLQKIDWTKIEALNKETDLNEGLKTQLELLKTDGGHGFDFLEYAVPYFWGSLGLLYNSSVEGLEEKVKSQGWSILADQSLETMIYDSSRDAFMAALAKDNIRLDEATDAQIKTAKEWLISAKGKKTSIKSDEILDEAIGGKTPYDVAMVYSGDAVYIMQETENYKYYAPELTNIWIDGFVIPQNAKNTELAYEFINYLSSYDANLENTAEIGYTSPRNDVVLELLKTDEFKEERIAITFKVEGIVQSQFFRYNNKLKESLVDAWGEVKASR